jgi:hypothetical protein
MDWMDCACSRCMGEGPNCLEGGEHDYRAGDPRCHTCGKMDHWVGIMAQQAKAERAGLSCEDHFHRTAGTKALCTTPLRHPVPEGY